MTATLDRLAGHSLSASLLLTPGGMPVPPQSVVRGLAAISPRLRLDWCAGAHVPYWGLKEQWPHGDPRWERVQRGEMSRDMAFDLVQMFPRDCSTEEMVAYVATRWGDRNRLSKGDAAAEAGRIVDAAKASAASTQEAAVQRTLEESLDRHERESRHALRVRAGVEAAHPMVQGGL